MEKTRNEAISNGETIDPSWAISELVEDFLIRCRIRGYASTTIKLYEDDLGAFCRFLAPLGVEQVGKIRHIHIEDFLGAARGRGCSAHTVQRLYRGLRSFMHDLSRRYEEFNSPIEKIAPPKVPLLRPKALTLEQIQQLIAICNSAGRGSGRRGATARRDGFFIRFLFDSGLRVSEALSIRLDDIDMRQGTVLIRKGKGDRPRALMIGLHTLLEMRRYLRSIREGATFLFPSRRNRDRGMDSKYLRKRLRELGKRAGFHVTPHRLRHSCARQMCLDGASIQTIQARLGHTTPQMSLHYAKLFSMDTLEQGRKYSPGDRL